MKSLMLAIAVAAILGIATAWTINYNQYGYREAAFGPFELDGKITAENVLEHVNYQASEGLGKIQLLQDSTYDFGIMAPGQKGEHVFRVKNVGDGMLRLRVSGSTCKCTVSDTNKEVLEPGEETEVKLSWTVTSGVGEFAQSANLVTTDPAQLEIKLQIVGQVVRGVQPMPQVWTFGDASPRAP